MSVQLIMICSFMSLKHIFVDVRTILLDVIPATEPGSREIRIILAWIPDQVGDDILQVASYLNNITHHDGSRHSAKPCSSTRTELIPFALKGFLYPPINFLNAVSIIIRLLFIQSA